MTRATLLAKLLANAAAVLAAIGIAVAGDAITGSARAQAYYYYQCPAGYYWDPNYGCLPLNYFYGPPAYVYPDIGFGFFYGGRWYGHPYHGAPHGGAPHGAPPHGGAPHGAPHGGGGHH